MKPKKKSKKCNSAEIIHIGTTPNNMLATLEDLAEWVRRGEIKCFVICAVGEIEDEEVVHSSIIADKSLFTLLGAVTDMQRTITDKIQRRDT